MMKKNKLAQLAKAELNIAAFQKLSHIHERTLTEHNDQLEFTWKNGYDTGVRDANMTHAAVTYEPTLNAQPRSNARPPKILEPDIQFVSGELIVQKAGWVVKNWRKGWLWLSNWIFILIAWIAYNGIPPELLALIPEANRTNVIPILSALGVICRFIDQSRKKPLPEVKAVQEVV